MFFNIKTKDITRIRGIKSAFVPHRSVSVTQYDMVIFGNGKNDD